MRNPARSVRRLTQLATLGTKVAALWKEFEDRVASEISGGGHGVLPDFMRRGAPLGIEVEIILEKILKEKEDGSIKRRIILDMRRSFGNSRAKVGERIVLPRLTDVTAMLQDMWKPRGGHKGRRRDGDPDDFELYLVDLEDAFCHFPVRREELRHSVTLDEWDQDALVWTAMLFGYRATLLVMR